MPGYATRTLTVDVGAQTYRLRVLSDRQQFADREALGAVQPRERRTVAAPRAGDRHRRTAAAAA